MTQMISGRFVFIPDDGSEPFEIELEDIRDAKPLTLVDRFWIFFNKIFKKKLDAPQLPPPAPDIPALVCGKLEELFCTAVWYGRDHFFDSKPSYIMDVFPRAYAEGWEPVVRLAHSTGHPKELSLAELLTEYVPVAPDSEDLHS